MAQPSDRQVMARAEVTGEKNTRGGDQPTRSYIAFGADTRAAVRALHALLGEQISAWGPE